jgi:hypothetical protein
MVARDERVKGRFRYPALECPQNTNARELSSAGAAFFKHRLSEAAFQSQFLKL